MTNTASPKGKARASAAVLDRALAAGIRHLGDFTTNPRVLFVAAVAVLVGTGGVVSGVILLHLIRVVTNLAYFGAFSLADLKLGQSPLGPLMVVVPVVGALIIGLMARYGSEKIRGHGIPEAIEAILLGRSRLDLKVAILKPLSSAISIGTGGPFGAEGPIIMTGGAIGSLIAQLAAGQRQRAEDAAGRRGCRRHDDGVRHADRRRHACRRTAAVRMDPAQLRSRRGGRHHRRGGADRGSGLPSPLFPFLGSMDVTLAATLCWVLVGLLSGLLSGVLTRLVYACEDAFLKLPIHWMWWPMLGGLVVGIGGLIDPRALGVGYDNIALMLQGTMPPPSALLLLAVKGVIWAVALGSGTSGGVLAPLLIMGGGMGAALAHVLPDASPGFWALLAMAATMGGTMRSPLTATFFAVELTGNTHVLLPLLAACVTAHLVTVLLMRRSILTEKVARRGHHLSREYRVDPFSADPRARRDDDRRADRAPTA